MTAKLRGVASVGIVDCDRNGQFCGQMGVQAYPALRWWGGGGGQGEQLPQYNIQQGVILDIWADGVLAAASAARGARATPRSADPEGGERAGEGATEMDWSTFEETAPREQRQGGSVDEAGSVEVTEGVAVLIVVVALLAAVAILAFTLSDDGGDEQYRRPRPASQQRPAGLQQAPAARAASGLGGAAGREEGELRRRVTVGAEPERAAAAAAAAAAKQRAAAAAVESARVAERRGD